MHSLLDNLHTTHTDHALTNHIRCRRPHESRIIANKLRLFGHIQVVVQSPYHAGTLSGMSVSSLFENGYNNVVVPIRSLIQNSSILDTCYMNWIHGLDCWPMPQNIEIAISMTRETHLQHFYSWIHLHACVLFENTHEASCMKAHEASLCLGNTHKTSLCILLCMLKFGGKI